MIPLSKLTYFIAHYLKKVKVKCFLPGVLKSPNRSTWLLIEEPEAFIGSRVGCGNGAERTFASSSIAVAVFVGEVVTWDDWKSAKSSLLLVDLVEPVVGWLTETRAADAPRSIFLFGVFFVSVGFFVLSEKLSDFRTSSGVLFGL